MTIDPRICNISIDANAIDRDGSDRDVQVDRFQALTDAGEWVVLVAGGVRDEVQHPNTPQAVQRAVSSGIFNLRPGLNNRQQEERRQVQRILQGNALPGRHAADASHLSEAAETGCSYFITHDQRILNKRQDLRAVLPPNLFIVTLQEFLEIYDQYVAADNA